MTNIGHRLSGVGAALLSYGLAKALHLDELQAATAATTAVLGTNAPDWLEIRVARGEGSFTLIPHRTITHWILPWVGILGYAVLFTQQADLPLAPGFAAAGVIGFTVGGLTHLLADVCNPMGVPLWLPFKSARVSLNLWKSGKYELTQCLGYAVVCYLIMKLLTRST